MNRDQELEGIQSYGPWGTLRSDVGDKTHLGFQSDHTDRDVGVVDMGARYYLPELGRFITQDTYTGVLAAPLTQNRYVYGLNDPVSNLDATGHSAADANAGGCRGTCSRVEEGVPAWQAAGYATYLDWIPARIETLSYIHTRRHLVVYGAAGMPIGTPRPESGGIGSWFSIVLDVVGLVPIVGDAVDGVRCGVETIGGNATADTALTCAAIVPGAGWAAFGAKGVRRLSDVASATRGISSTVSSPSRLSRLLADETGSLALRRFTGDQDALIQLAKEAKQLGGVSSAEADILVKWAGEYGLRAHAPMVHPGRLTSLWSHIPHINIGPVRHIPVVGQ